MWSNKRISQDEIEQVVRASRILSDRSEFSVIMNFIKSVRDDAFRRMTMANDQRSIWGAQSSFNDLEEILNLLNNVSATHTKTLAGGN